MHRHAHCRFEVCRQQNDWDSGSSTCVTAALQAREWYREDLVGKAIADSGVSRDQLFLTSKLHPRHHGYESAAARIKQVCLIRGQPKRSMSHDPVPHSSPFAAPHCKASTRDCGRAWWTSGRTRLTCFYCITLGAGMDSAAMISRKAPGGTAGAPWRMQSLQAA